MKYNLYKFHRELVIFEEGNKEFWIDKITTKIPQNDDESRIERVRAQNVHTNELTDWKEYIDEKDAVKTFVECLSRK